MTTTQELMDELAAGRQEISTLYQSLPVSALEMPELSNGWSVKDLLAHLAAWEQHAASALASAAADDAPLLEDFDVDAMNEEFYRQRLDWSWEEVEAEFQAAFHAVRQAIADLPPARLESQAVQRTIRADTVEHYAEHLPDLRRWHRRWQERRR